MQISKIVSAAALVILAWGCGNKQSVSEQPILAVSIEPQRNILEQIAGPDFKVTTVLGRGADPETFDPSTPQRMAVDHADIYFATGVLPFEERLKQSLAANTTYVSTADSSMLIYGTHGHEHSHGHSHEHGDHHDHQGAPDPHYWTSFAGLSAMAQAMAQSLAEAYPDRANDINERCQATLSHLDSLKAQVQTRLAGAGGSAFAVWHPSLSYFAREFGLEQVSLGAEGKELSAKAFAAAIDHARADSVKVFFFQPGIDSRQAEVLSQSIGTRLVPIDPLSYHWEKEIKTIADELARP